MASTDSKPQCIQDFLKGYVYPVAAMLTGSAIFFLAGQAYSAIKAAGADGPRRITVSKHIDHRPARDGRVKIILHGNASDLKAGVPVYAYVERRKSGSSAESPSLERWVSPRAGLAVGGIWKASIKLPRAVRSRIGLDFEAGAVQCPSEFTADECVEKIQRYGLRAFPGEARAAPVTINLLSELRKPQRQSKEVRVARAIKLPEREHATVPDDGHDRRVSIRPAQRLLDRSVAPPRPVRSETPATPAESPTAGEGDRGDVMVTSVHRVLDYARSALAQLEVAAPVMDALRETAERHPTAGAVARIETLLG